MPFWVTSECGAGVLHEYCTIHEVSGPFLDHNCPALVASISSIDVASPCKGFRIWVTKAGVKYYLVNHCIYLPLP